MYYIDQNNGQLHSLTPQTVTTGDYPDKLLFDPSGKYLFALTSKGIYTYLIDSNTGILSQIHVIKLQDDQMPSSLIFNPSGEYMYVLGRGSFEHPSASVTVYQFDTSNGILTPESKVLTGFVPVKLLHDTSWKYLYVLSNGSDGININQIYTYKINDDGRLVLLGKTGMDKNNPNYFVHNGIIY
jgi:6-phosphogluconolactonase (cycloisomerase 2 family)